MHWARAGNALAKFRRSERRNPLLFVRGVSCILLQESGEMVMGRMAFIWDLEDDSEGNYWHICVEGHGVTREEVEEVLIGNYGTAARSRSSGQPEAFGWTASGKYLTVVFEQVSDDPLTVYPITAYEVPPPGPKKRRKSR
jgi:hypothetical protein